MKPVGYKLRNVIRVRLCNNPWGIFYSRVGNKPYLIFLHKLQQTLRHMWRNRRLQ